MSKYAEVRSDYYVDAEEKLYIDAWLSIDDNEEGKVIAKINLKTYEIEYLDGDARTDEYAQEIIKETMCDILQEALTNVINEREGAKDGTKKAERLDELYLEIDNELTKWR